MTAPNAVPASITPRVNPLQRLWLREIGMERLWLRPAAAPAVVAPAPQVLVSKPDSAVVAQAPDAAPARAMAPVAPAAATSAAPAAVARAGNPVPAVRSGPPPRPAAKADPAPDTAPVRVPVAESVKHATLDELREQVVACTACGLCEGRRHAVFGHGGQPTRWLVVGEAPGEQEDRQGQPFVGRSGQLLDAMLSAVGMSRERDVFIANVIKCRPPGNRNPKPEEIAACSPYLMRQIALLKPERILVLGRFAAQALLGTDATIGSLRGRVHQMKTDEGREIPVIVSYHPAYLLRSPVEKARAWQDLKLAARM
ncbi:uracil-DNA glycosylase family protein [Achromobacter sp. UMC71]|uniref:uracil-DNA glycosylase n=1 Tax=Achromobacter sp. UMC71 TaxID=1862320 RepID=UPI001602689D|nr:uracil-DNA glycosylase [Achromobacter sp. UMC71]MBB1628519.1 uracil-DNA glycosylase [Achromobacter sp. UMC71]